MARLHGFIISFLLSNLPFLRAQSLEGCIRSLNTIYERESRVADDSKLRKYILCPNTEYHVALNFADNGRPLDGQYPIPVGRPNIHVLCGEDGLSENNCQLVRGLVHVGVVDEFGTGKAAKNVLLQGLTFFRATSVNVIAMIGGDISIRDCVFKVSSTSLAFVTALPGLILSSFLDFRETATLPQCMPSPQRMVYVDYRKQPTTT